MTQLASPHIMPDLRGRIAKQFHDDDTDRQEILDRARLCAALTKPWILPPKNQRKNSKLPENYQAIGARGVNNLEGLMLLALYPPDYPWYELSMPADIRYDQTIPVEVKNLIIDDLFHRELLILALLESVSLLDKTNRRQQAFRSNKRAAIGQIVVTGDGLERMNPDYSITVFRRTNYITRRDSSGNVTYHITKEAIDPLALDDKQFAEAKVGTRDELKKLPPNKRTKFLHTLCEWQPWVRKWSIVQEINGYEINTSDDAVSPYFSTPFELAPEEDYGRGLIEQNLGDLRSYNELREKLLDFAANFSKILWVIDQDEMTFRPKDLEKKSGETARGKVSNGKVQSVGCLAPENIPQFQVVERHAATINRDLGRAFLIESEIQPQKERVTKYQLERIAHELEGNLGGVYAPVAEAQQLQTIRRTMFQMGRDGIMQPLPEELVEIRALTGISALRRENERSKLFNLSAFVANLNEQALRKIDFGVLVDAAARLSGLDVPGLIRSNEELAREDQRLIAQQTQLAAAQKAVDVAGNVAEANLLPEAA